MRKTLRGMVLCGILFIFVGDLRIFLLSDDCFSENLLIFAQNLEL